MEKEISPQNTKGKGNFLFLLWKALETCVVMYTMYVAICHKLRYLEWLRKRQMKYLQLSLHNKNLINTITALFTLYRFQMETVQNHGVLVSCLPASHHNDFESDTI